MAKKPWKGRLGLVLVPRLSRLLLPLYWMTCRQRPTIGQEHLDAVIATGRPVIACFWHEMLLMGGRLIRDLDRNLPFSVLVSPSEDGELATRVALAFGVPAVRASSSNAGLDGMKELYRQVGRDGRSPVVTADGPRGPRHVFKPGAIRLARRTGAPILPLAYAARRARKLDSWDRFIVPRPFSPIVWAVGEPRYLSRGAGRQEVASIQRELEATMAQLVGAAERAIRPPRRHG